MKSTFRRVILTLIVMLSLGFFATVASSERAHAQLSTCGVFGCKTKRAQTEQSPVKPPLRFMIQGKWLYDPEAPPPDMPLHLHDVWQRGTSQPIPDQFKRNAKAQVLHRANWMGFMDDRLCQRTPTLYLADTGNRWGYYLYENGNGSADVLISAVQELVEANCRAGEVTAVRIVVGQLGLGRRNHPITGAEIDPKNAPQYLSVYKGLIVPAEGYVLLHDEPNGLNRYMRQNGQYEEMATRMAERRAYHERIAKSKFHSLEEYCQTYPNVCVAAGVVAVAIAGSSSPNVGDGQTYQKCVFGCEAYMDPNARYYCRADCTRLLRPH